MRPVEGRPLIMYLTILENSMRCVLGQYDYSGQKKHAIYYLSKKFTDGETRYSVLEKNCCALAWAARRLRQYILTHTTLLISKMDPISLKFSQRFLLCFKPFDNVVPPLHLVDNLVLGGERDGRGSSFGP